MSLRASAALFLLSALLSNVAAQDAAQIVKRTKRATALVILDGTPRGTAFSIDANGLFVTDRRVLEGITPVSHVRLAVNSGDADEKRLEANVVRSDQDTGLALLQVPGADFPALPLGNPEVGLVETMSVTAYGYPTFRRPTEKDLDYTISVNVGRVTSFRKLRGRLTVIELDARLKLNPGFAGGPVVDADGRVMGIARAAAPTNNSYINSATAVSELTRLLDTPAITFEVATLEEAQSLQPHAFPIRIAAVRNPETEWAVEVEFRQGIAEPRRFEARKGQDGVYALTAVLLPDGLGPELVRVEAEFPEGSLKGRTEDRDVTVGDQTVRLSKIRSLEPGSSGQPPRTLVGDQELRGVLRGLEETIVDFGQVSTKVDLTRATRVKLTPLDRVPAPVMYRVVVRDGERVAAEARGQIAITSKPAVKAPMPPPESQPDPMSGPASSRNTNVPQSSFAPVLELTDRAPQDWILKEAKVGAYIRQDRQYAFTSLPGEMVGGTLVWREATDGWLDAAAVRALKPCFAYALVRTREHGKSELGEVALTKFLREGWEQVADPVTTNVDAAFDTRWIALRKAIPAGRVVLQLNTINHGHGREATVFVFKEGGDARPDPGDSWPETVKAELYRSDVVELTDKASPNWIFKEARVGTSIESDRDYFLTSLPKEIAGGTQLVRESSDHDWLGAGAVKALTDCTAYVLIRSRYLGKETLGEADLASFEREGWTKVEGKTAVTFPNGEDWQWIAFKRGIAAGPVALSAGSGRWGGKAVVFVFKR